MAGLFWADADYGVFTFIGLTLILGGAGAFATGRALSKTWRPMPMLLPYMLLLTAGVQFLHYALYQESWLSPGPVITAYVWLLLVGVLGYRQMRAGQMASQYSWAYDRVGLNWRPKRG